jgi:hypothetical protein
LAIFLHALDLGQRGYNLSTVLPSRRFSMRPRHVSQPMSAEATDESAGKSRYLRLTPMLDFDHPTLLRLVAERGWRDLSYRERIGVAYEFVRNEIAFGYNSSDDLTASQVLEDGYGQCNTKTTLLMALLRGLGIPCRFHGFTVHKRVQRGVVPEHLYRRAPSKVIHSWVEVLDGDRWVELEGFILDQNYLTALQQRFPDRQGAFCGYGVATDHFESPAVRLDMSKGTHIQREAIADDLGVFDEPDAFYAKYGANFSGLRGIFFSHVVRRLMNARVDEIRAGATRAPHAIDKSFDTA